MDLSADGSPTFRVRAPDKLGHGKNTRVGKARPHDLQTDWKARRGLARRHGAIWKTDQRDQEGWSDPIDVIGQLPARDVGGEVHFDREGWDGRGRRDEEIVACEQRAETAPYLLAHVFGCRGVAHRERQSLPHIAAEIGAEPVELMEMVDLLADHPLTAQGL